MTRFIIASTLVLATLVVAAQAHAEDVRVPPKAGYAIQDKPQLLGDMDYYGILTEAEASWKEVLPKLKRNYFDYESAWNRLRERKFSIRSRWFGFYDRADYFAPEKKVYKEMHDWCGDAGMGDPPKDDAKDAAFEFAQLDVRVRLCEQTLPTNVGKSPVLQPSSDDIDTRPMSYPNKPQKLRKHR